PGLGPSLAPSLQLSFRHLRGRVYPISAVSAISNASATTGQELVSADAGLDELPASFEVVKDIRDCSSLGRLQVDTEFKIGLHPVPGEIRRTKVPPLPVCDNELRVNQLL